MDRLTPLQSEILSKMQNYALALLARRDYAEAEISNKLCRKFSTQAFAQLPKSELSGLVEKTIQWLSELGYLSDEKYCRMFIDHAISSGRGRLRILQELRQKQLDKTMVAEALDAAEVDWHEVAYQTMVRKFHTPPEDNKAKAKVIRFLQYRGFYPEEVFEALARWRLSGE